MNRIDERTVHTNFQEIIDNADKSKAVNYAVNYAKAGLRMTGYELVIQAKYVLSNITHWRGEQAKRIRENLKSFTTQNNY